jgi:hypothetical protein
VFGQRASIFQDRRDSGFLRAARGRASASGAAQPWLLVGAAAAAGAVLARVLEWRSSHGDSGG